MTPKQYLSLLLRNQAPRQVCCLKRDVVKSFREGHTWIENNVAKTNDGKWAVRFPVDEHGMYAEFI